MNIIGFDAREKGSLKEFSKFKYLTSNNIHMIIRCFDLLFNALHQERKRKKMRKFLQGLYGYIEIWSFSSFYKH